MVDRLISAQAGKHPLLSFEGIDSRGIPPEAVFEFIESNRSHWAYSSVGLEHTPDKREVGSSNLPRPTSQCDVRSSRCRRLDGT